MTFPVVPVVPDRPARPVPRLVLIALGVGVIAFVAGLQFGGGSSSQTAALAATSQQPSPSASASTAPTGPALATAAPGTSTPGSSRFARSFDATQVIRALPGGTNCIGGRAGPQLVPGPYPNETFVRTWMTFCPIAQANQDAFLREVVEAITPVDRPARGEAGMMAVTAYAEGSLVGTVTLATHESADGIEVAVTLEEQRASFGRPDVSAPSDLAPSATQTPGPAATPVALPAATAPVPLPAVGALAPGTYSLANPYVTGNSSLSCLRGCADYRRIIFTLPAGWATSDGLVYKHLDQAGEVAFSAWTVDKVYADPCHWRGSALSPLDIASTHLSGAFIYLENTDGGLTNQAGRHASALAQVTLGGVYALRVDLSVPADLDVSTCDQGQFRSWSDWEVVDGANSHNAPGQLDSVYMVDVDRRPLVIDVSHMPETSTQDLAELDAILASMTIDRG